MGRRCDYSTPKPPPADATRRLSEALLGSEMAKRGKALLIKFDELDDSNTVHRTLCSLRDGYDPRR
jgi:hypothetical protein